MIKRKCSDRFGFVVNESCSHIELRNKEGDFEMSICCPKCLPALELAIKLYKKHLKKIEVSQ